MSDTGTSAGARTGLDGPPPPATTGPEPAAAPAGGAVPGAAGALPGGS